MFVLRGHKFATIFLVILRYKKAPTARWGFLVGLLWRIACARRAATMGCPYRSNYHNPDQPISQSQHFEFGAAVALVLFFGAGLFYYQLRFAISFGGDALGLDSF